MIDKFILEKFYLGLPKLSKGELIFFSKCSNKLVSTKVPGYGLIEILINWPGYARATGRNHGLPTEVAGMEYLLFSLSVVESIVRDRTFLSKLILSH